jgi:uncharacterized membrane protein
LGVGLGSMSAYLLIRAAFQQAHASYVVAAREFSIAVAIALGVVALKEPLPLPKALSAAAILVERYDYGFSLTERGLANLL